MGNKFLIVSDELATRMMLIEVIKKLRLSKFPVTEAESVFETYLKFQKENSINCVIVDKCKPFNSGLEIIRALRKSNDPNIKKDIRIIALIGDRKKINKAVDAGADDCLEISFTLDEFKEKIDGATSKEQILNLN